MGRRDESVLAYARELEDADRELARASGEVEELGRAVEALRARAREIDVLLARLPVARRGAEEGVREAERALARRLEELREAESDLAESEGSDDEERIAAARRAVVRTRDAAASAERRLDRAREARERLERDVEDAGEELPALADRGRELARRIGALPRVSPHAGEAPAPDPAGLVAWAAKAGAALFVAAGALASERERVVREANELGASALGEPLAATSVALVRERLERL